MPAAAGSKDIWSRPITAPHAGIREHPTTKVMQHRMRMDDLALSRGKYLPDKEQYVCQMPLVPALPRGWATPEVANSLPAARGLFRRSLPQSPYHQPYPEKKPASRWCDREDEPGWPGHQFKHRTNALGQAKPQLDFTSQPGSADPSRTATHRPSKRTSPAPGSIEERQQHYSLNPEQVRVYQRFVELLAGLEKPEMVDVAEDIIKDAQEKQLLDCFGGAASP